ncbi:MAG: PHP domain-containing protein [Firmicutes bacterium]|nr:PHP domain-containing protein [Bacillota bacterium]
MTREKTDLHLHSYFSDGTMSPTALVERAVSLGQNKIAITDHDGIDGVEEAVRAGEKLGVEVVPGIEFSTSMEDGPKIHMLGYGIDIYDRRICLVLDALKDIRRERNVRLLKVLGEMGYEISADELEQGDGRTYIGKPDIAIVMAKKGYIKDPNDAFGPGGVFSTPEVKAVKKSEIDTIDAMRLIHVVGGITVLAHPGKLKRLKKPDDLQQTAEKGTDDFYRAVDALVERLIVEGGLDGIECRHTDHTERDCVEFEKTAKKYNLIITGGSDYHGPEFAGHRD